MAETFANSGNSQLLEAARSWASRHGYVENVGPGAQEAFWGEKEGTRIKVGIPLGTPIPRTLPDGGKSQAPSPKSSKDSSSQSPAPPDASSNVLGPQDPLRSTQQIQTGLDRLRHTQHQRETAFYRLQDRDITRKPLEDPTKQNSFSNPAAQRPFYDPARERTLADPARQKPLVEPWRQVPDPARLPSLAPPVPLPPDPGRLAPPPRMSVPSFGPSFGQRF